MEHLQQANSVGDRVWDKRLCKELKVSDEQLKDMRAFLDESPQTVKVFMKVLATLYFSSESRLKTSSDEQEIFRMQGSLRAIDDVRKYINNIRGNI